MVAARQRRAGNCPFAESTEKDSKLDTTNESRILVFHYHLFKNAGTSVDEMLRANFGTRWTSQEFAGPRHKRALSVARFLRERPHLDAISSHTALLPVPRIEGLRVFPIIFIRHPIDRLRSAYEFELKQADDTPGARLAKAHDFRGYMVELLKSRNHRHVRNFQTLRLSQNEPPSHRSERERAIGALQSLPFIGVVEEYDCSINRLQKLLSSFLPNFRAMNVRKNTTLIVETTLGERLAAIERRLGRDLYLEVCAANEDDLAIYNWLEINGRYSEKNGTLQEA